MSTATMESKPMQTVTTTSDEIWKPIPGFEGYEASSMGRIRSVDGKTSDGKKRKGKILKPKPNKKRGRRFVSLGRQGEGPVAVYVAMAFLNHSPNRLESIVDHINEDCTDDRLENLQIISHRENIAKGLANKTKASGLPTGVSRTRRNKKPYMANIYVNGKTKHLGAYYTIEEASEAYQKAAEALAS